MAQANVTDRAHEVLIGELLYEQPPVLRADTLSAAMAAAHPQCKLISKPNDHQAILFGHSDYLIEHDGKNIPAMTSVTKGNPVDPGRLATALSQTRDWPLADQIASRCRYRVVVMEMLSQARVPGARFDAWNRVMLKVIETTAPRAVHLNHCEKVLDPAQILRASGSASANAKLCTLLNVRRYDISDRASGEMLMDTRGMPAVGLPDIQIHFRNLDAAKLDTMLFNLALYLFNRGDVMADGQIIKGFAGSGKWKCQHEQSLAGPTRLVIDIDAGDPHGAGNRKR
jgi:hypothetical protein